MKVEIVEAKLHHCGKAVRRMRKGHRDVLDGMGIESHRKLRDVFAISKWRRSLLIDGELAAMAGMTGSALSSEATIWITLTDVAERHPIVLARVVLREMEAIFRVKRRLTINVLSKDIDSLRLAYFLGFASKGSPVEGQMVMVAETPTRKAA